MRHPIRVVIAAACGALLFAFGCGEKKPPGFVGSGTLEATEVTVSAQAGGQILLLAAEEGTKKAKGDTLAVIDVEKLVLQRRQLAAARAEIASSRDAAHQTVVQARDNLANVEKSYLRIKEIFEKGSATQQQFDDISTKRSVARSQLEAATSQLGVLDAKEAQLEASIALLDRQIADGTVLSPLGGTVVEKYVERGEVVPPGGAVCKIADLAHLKLKIFISEKDLGGFTLGDAVSVRVDAHPEPLRAIVTWVSPEAEFTPKNVQTKEARAELVYAVRVTIDSPPASLKIGMPAEVYLEQP